MQVVAPPDKELVRHLLDDELQVPWVPIDDGLTLLKLHNLRAILHARLHVHPEKLCLAGVLHVWAVLANLLRVLLIHTGPKLAGDHFVLAVALASAGSWLDDVLVAGDREGGSEVQIAQRDLKLGDNVITLWRPSVLLLPAEATKPSKAAKHLREDVLRVAASLLLPLVLLQTLLAVAVIDLPLLGIREDLVGASDLGKRLGCRLLLLWAGLDPAAKAHRPEGEAEQDAADDEDKEEVLPAVDENKADEEDPHSSEAGEEAPCCFVARGRTSEIHLEAAADFRSVAVAGSLVGPREDSQIPSTVIFAGQ
mmetsp:Transcript_20663/g.57371  ORF Transcript_20663/g.57371 Transcript_20663/m.57371 type:complete len:309 (-) Transcript_20663:229-1155(-)